jgi:hypothetical protein
VHVETSTRRATTLDEVMRIVDRRGRVNERYADWDCPSGDDGSSSSPPSNWERVARRGHARMTAVERLDRTYVNIVDGSSS